MDGRTPPPEIPVPAPENVQAAKAATLRYVNDRRPGITRVAPAWTEVWICPLENGHMLEFGRALPAIRRRCSPRWAPH